MHNMILKNGPVPIFFDLDQDMFDEQKLTFGIAQDGTFLKYIYTNAANCKGYNFSLLDTKKR